LDIRKKYKDADAVKIIDDVKQPEDKNGRPAITPFFSSVHLLPFGWSISIALQSAASRWIHRQLKLAEEKSKAYEILIRVLLPFTIQASGYYLKKLNAANIKYP
jgi:hypothetical protein